MGFCSSLSTCTGPSLARGEQRWLSRIYLDLETTKDIQNLNLSRQILAGGNHGELRTRRNRTSLGSCTIAAPSISTSKSYRSLYFKDKQELSIVSSLFNF